MIRRARLRLTLWYSAVLLILLLILSSVTYLAVTRTLRNELEDGIVSAVGQWLDISRRLPRPPGGGPAFPLARPRPAVPAEAAPSGDDMPPTDGTVRPAGVPRPPRPDLRLAPAADEVTPVAGSTSDVFLLAYRADGGLVVNERGVDAEAIGESAAIRSALAGRTAWATVEDDGERLRIYARPIMVGERTAGAVVGVRNLDEYDRQVRAVLTVLAALTTGGGLLSLAGAYIFAGRALRPLEMAYERQRAFVADASHELRSPLAVIRASSDLLLREPLSGPHRESVEEIRDVTQEAATLIDDLLELARAEQDVPGQAVCEPAVEIPAVITQMDPVLGRRHHTVSTVLSPVRAAAAGAEVRRIVRALLENVVSHTPEGTPVRVELAERGGNAVITVEDAGPGVPSSQQATIFERFARLDVARTPGTGHGAGLGLAIVRSLAERRGGSVAASRGASGGLRVDVSLPLAR